MIKLYHNPFLLDFIKAAANLPEDERAQITALTGHDYDIDGCAIGNFTVEGPKWVAKLEDETVLCVGGFVPQRPGVLRDFLLSTPEAWKPEHGAKLTRMFRRIMDALMLSGEIHRIETIVPATRLSSRPELERWYKILGYKKEAPLYGYCADGSDAWSFARVVKRG